MSSSDRQAAFLELQRLAARAASLEPTLLRSLTAPRRLLETLAFAPWQRHDAWLLTALGRAQEPPGPVAVSLLGLRLGALEGLALPLRLDLAEAGFYGRTDPALLAEERIRRSAGASVRSEVLRLMQCRDERADGSGPLGLAGEALDVPARLLAVATAFVRGAAAPGCDLTSLAALSRDAERFGEASVRRLIQALSALPLGSYVKLRSGATARVVGVRPEEPMRPKLHVRADDDVRVVEVPAADAAGVSAVAEFFDAPWAGAPAPGETAEGWLLRVHRASLAGQRAVPEAEASQAPVEAAPPVELRQPPASVEAPAPSPATPAPVKLAAAAPPPVPIIEAPAPAEPVVAAGLPPIPIVEPPAPAEPVVAAASAAPAPPAPLPSLEAPAPPTPALVEQAESAPPPPAAPVPDLLAPEPFEADSPEFAGAAALARAVERALGESLRQEAGRLEEEAATLEDELARRQAELARRQTPEVSSEAAAAAAAAAAELEALGNTLERKASAAETELAALEKALAQARAPAKEPEADPALREREAHSAERTFAQALAHEASELDRELPALRLRLLRMLPRRQLSFDQAVKEAADRLRRTTDEELGQFRAAISRSELRARLADEQERLESELRDVGEREDRGGRAEELRGRLSANAALQEQARQEELQRQTLEAQERLQASSVESRARSVAKVYGPRVLERDYWPPQARELELTLDKKRARLEELERLTREHPVTAEPEAERPDPVALRREAERKARERKAEALDAEATQQRSRLEALRLGVQENRAARERAHREEAERQALESARRSAAATERTVLAQETRRLEAALERKRARLAEVRRLLAGAPRSLEAPPLDVRAPAAGQALAGAQETAALEAKRWLEEQKRLEAEVLAKRGELEDLRRSKLEAGQARDAASAELARKAAEFESAAAARLAEARAAMAARKAALESALASLKSETEDAARRRGETLEAFQARRRGLEDEIQRLRGEWGDLQGRLARQQAEEPALRQALQQALSELDLKLLEARFALDTTRKEAEALSVEQERRLREWERAGRELEALSADYGRLSGLSEPLLEQWRELAGQGLAGVSAVFREQILGRARELGLWTARLGPVGRKLAASRSALEQAAFARSKELALRAFREGRLDEARSSLRQALSLNKEDAELRSLLARLEGGATKSSDPGPPTP